MSRINLYSHEKDSESNNFSLGPSASHPDTVPSISENKGSAQFQNVEEKEIKEKPAISEIKLPDTLAMNNFSSESRLKDFFYKLFQETFFEFGIYDVGQIPDVSSFQIQFEEEKFERIRPGVLYIQTVDAPFKSFTYQGRTRQGLEITEAAQRILDKIPCQIGQALGEGDCFYDGVAQWLENLGVQDLGIGERTQPLFKQFRLLCQKYANDADSEDKSLDPRKPKNWLKTKFKNKNDFDQYLLRVQWSKEEAQKAYNDGFCNVEPAYWGDPGIDGRILCDYLKEKFPYLKIHVVTIQENPEHKSQLMALHSVYTATEQKDVQPESINYHDPYCFHLALYHNHYVVINPIREFKSEVKEEKTNTLYRFYLLDKHNKIVSRTLGEIPAFGSLEEKEKMIKEHIKQSFTSSKIKAMKTSIFFEPMWKVFLENKEIKFLLNQCVALSQDICVSDLTTILKLISVFTCRFLLETIDPVSYQGIQFFRQNKSVILLYFEQSLSLYLRSKIISEYVIGLDQKTLDLSLFQINNQGVEILKEILERKPGITSLKISLERNALLHVFFWEAFPQITEIFITDKKIADEDKKYLLKLILFNPHISINHTTTFNADTKTNEIYQCILGFNEKSKDYAKKFRKRFFEYIRFIFNSLLKNHINAVRQDQKDSKENPLTIWQDVETQVLPMIKNLSQKVINLFDLDRAPFCEWTLDYAFRQNEEFKFYFDENKLMYEKITKANTLTFEYGSTLEDQLVSFDQENAIKEYIQEVKAFEERCKLFQDFAKVIHSSNEEKCPLFSLDIKQIPRKAFDYELLESAYNIASTSLEKKLFLFYHCKRFIQRYDNSLEIINQYFSKLKEELHWETKENWQAHFSLPLVFSWYDNHLNPKRLESLYHELLAFKDEEGYFERIEKLWIPLLSTLFYYLQEESDHLQKERIEKMLEIVKELLSCPLLYHDRDEIILSRLFYLLENLYQQKIFLEQKNLRKTNALEFRKNRNDLNEKSKKFFEPMMTALSQKLKKSLDDAEPLINDEFDGKLSVMNLGGGVNKVFLVRDKESNLAAILRFWFVGEPTLLYQSALKTLEKYPQLETMTTKILIADESSGSHCELTERCDRSLQSVLDEWHPHEQAHDFNLVIDKDAKEADIKERLHTSNPKTIFIYGKGKQDFKEWSYAFIDAANLAVSDDINKITYLKNNPDKLVSTIDEDLLTIKQNIISYHALRQHTRLTHEQLKTLFEWITQTEHNLIKLAKAGIAFPDVKPGNLYLLAGYILFSDIKSFIRLNDGSIEPLVTPIYSPPEGPQPFRDDKIDKIGNYNIILGSFYSLGLTALHLLTGTTELRVLSKLQEDQGYISAFKKMINRLCDAIPQRRLNTDQKTWIILPTRIIKDKKKRDKNSPQTILELMRAWRKPPNLNTRFDDEPDSPIMMDLEFSDLQQTYFFQEAQARLLIDIIFEVEGFMKILKNKPKIKLHCYTQALKKFSSEGYIGFQNALKEIKNFKKQNLIKTEEENKEVSNKIAKDDWYAFVQRMEVVLTRNFSDTHSRFIALIRQEEEFFSAEQINTDILVETKEVKDREGLNLYENKLQEDFNNKKKKLNYANKRASAILRKLTKFKEEKIWPTIRKNKSEAGLLQLIKYLESLKDDLRKHQLDYETKLYTFHEEEDKKRENIGSPKLRFPLVFLRPKKSLSEEFKKHLISIKNIAGEDQEIKSPSAEELKTTATLKKEFAKKLTERVEKLNNAEGILEKEYKAIEMLYILGDTPRLVLDINDYATSILATHDLYDNLAFPLDNAIKHNMIDLVNWKLLNLELSFGYKEEWLRSELLKEIRRVLLKYVTRAIQKISADNVQIENRDISRMDRWRNINDILKIMHHCHHIKDDREMLAHLQRIQDEAIVWRKSTSVRFSILRSDLLQVYVDCQNKKFDAFILEAEDERLLNTYNLNRDVETYYTPNNRSQYLPVTQRYHVELSNQRLQEVLDKNKEMEEKLQKEKQDREKTTRELEEKFNKQERERKMEQEEAEAKSKQAEERRKQETQKMQEEQKQLESELARQKQEHEQQQKKTHDEQTLLKEQLTKQNQVVDQLQAENKKLEAKFDLLMQMLLKQQSGQQSSGEQNVSEAKNSSSVLPSTESQSQETLRNTSSASGGPSIFRA